MVLDRRISILELSRPQPGVYAWQELKHTWAHMEHTGKTNLFSKVGIGARTVVFTLRKSPAVTPHHTIGYRGRQYFITDVNIDDPLLMTVTTADIMPGKFTAYRPEEREGEYKSSVFTLERLCSFPARLTEKYLGFTQQEPHARTETIFVLVTPKTVELEVHDIVRTGPEPAQGAEDERPAYIVRVCHLLDEYKNEYEITRKEDV